TSQNSPTWEHKPIGGSSQVFETPVHSDAADSMGLRHRRRDNDVDVEMALSLRVHQRGRGRVLPGQKFPLVLADPHRKDQPTGMGRDGDGLFLWDPTKGALVQTHAGWPERSLLLGIGLHGLSDSGDG